jgi:hypothetical protein
MKPLKENDLPIEDIDLHEIRMNEVILKRSNDDLISMLSYMSGYAGNSEFFDEAFQSALVYIGDEN